MDLLLLESRARYAGACVVVSVAVATALPGLLPAWLLMLVLATSTMVFGILHGTARSVEGVYAKVEQEASNNSAASWSGNEAEFTEGEEMTASHALTIPLIGSGVLLVLFFAFKVAFLNTLVSMYIAGVAGVSLYVNLGHFADLWRLASWASGDIPLIAVSTVLVAAWWLTDLPVLANTLAISLSLLMLKTTQLSSTKAGLILMCGLFFYDIFWVFGSERVFGSNVMVSVAKGVQAPIKLLIPRLDSAGNLVYGILGLGDIVLPGFFIKLMLRYDVRKGLDHAVHDHDVKTVAAASSAEAAKKDDSALASLDTVRLCPSWPPVFMVSIVAYLASLVATHVAMTVFHSAQPALLYIVPVVCGACVVFAAARGELRQLWSFKVQGGFMPLALADL